MKALAALVLGLFVPAPPAQDTWEALGSAQPTDGYSPSLSVSGVPAPGHVIHLSVAGGVPGGLARIHAGMLDPANSPRTLVPSPERIVDIPLDDAGSGERLMTWPEVKTGSRYAFQGLIATGSSTQATTGAWVGTALAQPEAIAFAEALSFASGWFGVSVKQAKLAMTIQDETDRDTAAALIVDQGHLSNMDYFGAVVPPWTVDTVLNHYPFGSVEYAYYTGVIHAETSVGDDVVRIVWNHPNSGDFYSYALIRKGQLAYDSFAFTAIEDVYPPPVPSPPGGPLPTKFRLETPYRWPFGTRAWGEATSHPVCSGGVPVGCHGEPSSDAMPLFEVAVDIQCTVNGACCECTGTVGIASGFKSVSIKAGNGGVTVSGSLGDSRVRSGNFANCCP